MESDAALVGTLLIWLFVYLVSGLFFGFFSKNISEDKGRSPTEGFLIGFFLGVIGIIIVALLPANEAAISQSKLDDGTSKECPYCAEIIKSEALICKFCGRELPKTNSLVGKNQNLEYETKYSENKSLSSLIAILIVVAGFIFILVSIGLSLTH